MDRAILIRRRHKLKLPNAIIAATAMYLGLPLLTADRVFERLSDEMAILLYEP